MTPLKKTERWACLPTAFAMVTDLHADAFLGKGGEIVSDVSGPAMYRGLHIQEIIDTLLLLGYSVTEIEANPRLLIADKPTEIFTTEETKERFANYLRSCEGVLTGWITDKGWRHAYAVSYGAIFNPDTGLECVPAPSFVPDTFYVVKKNERQTTQRG
jgi:hypothetical protein